MEPNNISVFRQLRAKIPVRLQFLVSQNFLRFVVVGCLNTGIDLLIFNIAIYIFVFSSFENELIVAKVLGFFIASLNSYILNARFTFKKGLHKGDSTTSVAKKYGLFVLISLIGVCINVAVMFVLYRALVIILPWNEVLLANIATVGATGISLVWNFLAYRKFVFK